MNFWNLFTCEGTYTIDWVGRTQADAWKLMAIVTHTAHVQQHSWRPWLMMILHIVRSHAPHTVQQTAPLARDQHSFGGRMSKFVCESVRLGPVSVGHYSWITVGEYITLRLWHNGLYDESNHSHGWDSGWSHYTLYKFGWHHAHKWFFFSSAASARTELRRENAKR